MQKRKKTFTYQSLLKKPAISLILFLGINACSLTPSSFQTNSKPQDSFKSSAQSQSQVVASIASTSRSISNNFMCFNVNTIQVESWRNPQFWQAVNTLHPSLLRIPGGTVANYWDWQRGGLIQNPQSLPAGLPQGLRFRARQYTGGKLEDFKIGLQATQTTPLFVLNMLTSDLNSQLQMLETAQKMGLEVKYIELGNEFYFQNKNYKKVFPNPRAYAQTAAQWVRAIKQKFPEAQVAVIGVIPRADEEKNARKNNWNAPLVNTALPEADALTLHIYRLSGLETKEQKNVSYPFFGLEEVPEILGEPFRQWKDLVSDPTFQLIPNNKKIWITEYNLFEKIFDENKEKQDPKMMGSWAHGLYTLAMSLTFLEDQRIELICNHVLIGNSLFGAILANNQSFINPSEPVEVTPFSLSATGSTLRLLSQATLGMTQAQKIEFSNNPILNGLDNFNYLALQGWMFSQNKKKQAILVNFSNEILDINIDSISPKRANYEQVSADPRTLVTNPELITKSQGSILKNITLPAYSVTLLTDIE